MSHRALAACSLTGGAASDMAALSKLTGSFCSIVGATPTSNFAMLASPRRPRHVTAATLSAREPELVQASPISSPGLGRQGIIPDVLRL